MKRFLTPEKAPCIYSKTILSLFLLLLTNSFNLRATDLYWVGGTGNWSDYANHWATTSGGTTFHFTTPGPNDNVFFDANSFTTNGDTVHVDVATAFCKNYDWTGAQNLPTITSGNFYIYGSLNLIGNMTIPYYQTNLRFLATSPGNTINFAGHRVFNLTFSGVGGEWLLNSELNCNDIMFNEGVFVTNNYNIDCYSIQTNNSPTLWLGTSTITGPNIELFNPNLILDADSSNFIITNHLYCGTHIYNNATFSAGAADLVPEGSNFNTVIFTVGGQIRASINATFKKAIFLGNAVISGSNFFDTLFFNNPGQTVYLDSSIQTINNVLMENAFPGFPVLMQSNTPGYSAIISKSSGSVCLSYFILDKVTAIGGAQFYAGQGCIDLGGNTGWSFAPCTVTSDVWPGDANYDLTVNNFDVLNIGLAYGDTGAVRAGATNNYVAQPANDWNGFFQSAVNKKHADCNGDGIVNDNDTVAIALNYGQNHPARFANPDVQLLPAPTLYLEINPDSASLSDTINVDVFLGTSTTPVDSIYGIAFTLNFDTAYVDTTYMPFDYTGSWIGTPGVDLLTFQKTRFLDGAVDMAMVRTDHQNISGFGFLERIGIVVVDNIGARISTPFTLSNVRAITASEYELTINTNGDSLSIDTTSSVGINEIENLENMISVYPNPAREKITIRSGNLKMNVVEIYNSMGEMVLNEKINSNVFAVNTNNLEQGFYLIRCTTDKGIVNKRMVVAGKE